MAKMKLNKLDDFRWEIPQDYKQGMRVPGLIYADEAMINVILQDQSIEQVANVATLPGIVKRSMAMPDIHWGYGFPIGGVAATRTSDGVVSPGGVGYDINCGVRLLRTNLSVDEIKPKIKQLLNSLFNNVPSGLGSQNQDKGKGYRPGNGRGRRLGGEKQLRHTGRPDGYRGIGLYERRRPGKGQP
jgi:tRNA-splicing ligase RtcB